MTLLDIILNINNNTNRGNVMSKIISVIITFLNRINKTIYFNSITEEVIDKIINKELNNIREFYKEKNVKFTLSKKAFDDIKNLCEYEIYGARKVKKVINDYLESKLIDKIIEGNNNIKIMSLKTEVR